MGIQMWRETVEKKNPGITTASDKGETALSRASRILSSLFFGLAVSLLVVLTFLFAAAIHQNHEGMIFEIYGYLVWAGSLVLAVLVALAVFRP